MGKPLLTDEMIARANHGEKFDDKEDFDPEKTIVIHTDKAAVSDYSKSDIDSDYDDDFDFEDYDEDPIIKSRRIENAKRGEFQSKLNWILIGIALLLAVLIYAVFKL